MEASHQLSGNINYENDIQPMPTQYETGMPAGQLPPGTSYQAMKTAVGLNFDVFREPRGVMRILQFIFCICAFATTTSYSNSMRFEVTCSNSSLPTQVVDLPFSYPFRLDEIQEPKPYCHDGKPLHLVGNFSSDAQFFVATGVLSFLYCIAIVIVYVTLSDMYQSNGLLPLTDFILTVILSVFWLSGSGAWANGLNGLKMATDANRYREEMCSKPPNDFCRSISCGDYSGLVISVTLGFLNFFLWASDLWFLYKETPWFKMKQTTGGVGAAA
ncbi:Synaptophysin-like protein 2 [Gryllus bimaculatus]|nr:Synaptophysin-like protein 2 [Gryllus bimaculatus]